MATNLSSTLIFEPFNSNNDEIENYLEIERFDATMTVSGVRQVTDGVGETAALHWTVYLRDVCSWWLINHPRQIGGPGLIVEIDKSMMAKRKHNVGRVVPERWVLGGICPATGEGFMEVIPNKAAATLLPVIQARVAPGSIIHTDGHRVYEQIANLPVNPPYQHLVVIHDQNFVDPITGACTNHIECYWKNCKTWFKTMAGVHSSTLESHLDEFLWRQIHGRRHEDALQNILQHIGQWYPTP